MVSQLAQYNFEVKFRSGRSNTNAYSLSRYQVSSSVNQITLTTSLIDLKENSDVSSSVCVNQICAEKELECTPTLPEYSHDELKQLQNSDKTLSIVAKFVAGGKKPTTHILQDQPKDVRKLLQKFDSLCLINGVMYRTIDDPEIGECKQLLVPDSLKSYALDIMLNMSGHQATERTYALMKKRCYWFSMTLKNG